MVRRISSRFRPVETTSTLINTITSDGDHINDVASDIGSDIMTVSDIHTITNENEVAAMMQQQQQQQQPLNKQYLDLLTPTPTSYDHADAAAGGFGSHLYRPDDIRTIDNDNASIISDLQHTVGTIGGGGNDDIHTVTGTVSGSVLHLSSPNDPTNSFAGSTVVLGAAPNDIMMQPTPGTTEPPSSQQSLDNSFWSRTKRTFGVIPKINTQQRPTDGDEYYDEGRPIALLHNPTTVDGKTALMKNSHNNNNNDGENTSALPPAVIVTTRNNNNNNANNSLGGTDSVTNTLNGPTASVWKQRLCGLRADRLILLLMFVLLCAVGVIVGAIVVSQQQQQSSSRSNSSAASNAENERPSTEDEGTMITLTRTPTTSSPVVFTPTVAPIANTTEDRVICDSNITLLDDTKAIFPVTDALSNNNVTIEYNDCSWVSNQTVEQLDTLCQTNTVAYELCRFTCQNCEELSMNQKKPWPKKLCGEDSSDGSFDAGLQQGMGNCFWLSMAPFDVDRLCQPGSDAYNLCRETCRNCGPNDDPAAVTKTMSPSNLLTTAPSILNVASDAPSTSPESTPSTVPFALSQSPSAITIINATVSPTSIPSAPPIVTTVAPLTLSPVTLAPITLVPVSLSPTTAVPVSAVETLAGIILSASPASSDRLSTAGSSQAQALVWLQSALDVGTFGIEVSDARIVQIWTLATFAFSLGLDDVWLVSGNNDECLWDGIICSADTRTIAGIDLATRGLVGTLPPELTLLSGLIGLNLSENNISGKLPNNFGSTFQQLEDLRFDRNELTGILPSTIGSMSALRIWYMERNPGITGTVPSTVVQLSNLEEFVLYYTAITGVIPQGICDLPNLEELRLDCVKTSFTGDSCWTRCLFLCGGDSGVPCNN